MKPSRYRRSLGAVAAILLLIPRTPAISDVVTLRNGRTLDGIIEKETSAEVILNVGVGAVTLKRSQIAAIERSDTAQKEKIEKDWQAKYFTHERYTPADLRDFTAQFTGLQNKRRDAVEAVRRSAQVLKERADMKKELARLDSDITRLMSSIPSKQPDTPEALKTYNETVTQANAARARAAVLQNAIKKGAESADEHRRVVMDYMELFNLFEDSFARERTRNANTTNEQVAAFFAGTEQWIRDAGAEFKELSAPCEDYSGHALINARINDEFDVKLLLDTGSSFVVFSEALARRMKLALPDEAGIKLVQANGSEMGAKLVLLNSMQVGDARVENVPAAVIAQEGIPGIDGLLGMTFLREFSVGIDSANNKVVFRKLDPR